jgi:4'-phosphopantetheinyl transferase
MLLIQNMAFRMPTRDEGAEPMLPLVQRSRRHVAPSAFSGPPQPAIFTAVSPAAFEASPKCSLRDILLRRLWRDEVHIWTFDTADSSAVPASFERVLAAEELDRARKMHRTRRGSFVATRGTLRHLLGFYLDIPPAQVRFRRGGCGKPALNPRADIEFGVTSSHGFASIAITKGCEIGIDMEKIRGGSGTQEIAERFFCSEETSELMSLAAGERERAFFRCWTLKEAYIKATGKGLFSPLDSFRVTVAPGMPARLIDVSGDAGETHAWKLHDLFLASGYAAAIAYRDRQRRIRIFRVPDLAKLETLSHNDMKRNDTAEGTNPHETVELQ